MNEQLEGLNVTEQILLFRNFLTAAWPHLELAMEEDNCRDDRTFAEDWIEANWEILVAKELLGKEDKVLTPPSYVRNFKKPSLHRESAVYSVMTNSKKGCSLVETQYMHVEDKKEKAIFIEEPLRFCGLISQRMFKDTIFLGPPFDWVYLALDSQKKLFIAPLADLEFYLGKDSFFKENIQ